MFEIIVSEEFKNNFEKLPKSVKKKFFKKIKIFIENPFNPLLNTEKLGPPFKEIWSFRIDRSYRVILKFISSKEILLVTCGHHSWIYKTKL
jgi:mRNA-degrading endonuclease RelE of RelBE toxin-antitoxin system